MCDRSSFMRWQIQREPVMGYYGDEMAHLLNRQPPLIQLWPPTAKGNRYCCHGDKRCGPLARVANISYMEGGYEKGNFFFFFFFFFSGYDPIHWNGSTRTCLCYNVICDKQPPFSIARRNLRFLSHGGSISGHGTHTSQKEPFFKEKKL